MDHEILKIAADEALNVYKHAQYNIGTTEFSILSRKTGDGSPFNVLAIRGTDE